MFFVRLMLCKHHKIPPNDCSISPHFSRFFIRHQVQLSRHPHLSPPGPRPAFTGPLGEDRQEDELPGAGMEEAWVLGLINVW